ncbi:MAG: winged helix-turn-helix transcriptional regulator [Bacteroidota bacterium]|nr:winged helix-turn-helix transcriptional regulator [Bacteroidota bacterium]
MRRDVFQALADPTRRDILALVANESLNLNAVAENFDISRPAISKHIKILTECGLITINQVGRERYCEATLQQLKEVSEWIQQFKGKSAAKPSAPASKKAVPAKAKPKPKPRPKPKPKAKIVQKAVAKPKVKEKAKPVAKPKAKAKDKKKKVNDKNWFFDKYTIKDPKKKKKKR